MTNDTGLLRLWIVLIPIVCAASLPVVLAGDAEAFAAVVLLGGLELYCLRVLRARKRTIAEHGSIENLKAKIARARAEEEADNPQAQVDSDVAHGIGHRSQVRVRN